MAYTDEVLIDSPVAYWRLGTVGGRTDGSQGVLGIVDEVAIYSTALSLARIQAHYTAAISSALAFRH